MDFPALDSPRAIVRHVDALLTPSLRTAHSVLLVLCDDLARPLAHCLIEDVAADPAAEECVRIIEPFVMSLAEETSGCLLAVLTRPVLRDDPIELRWSLAVRTVCHRWDVRLLGVYLAISTGIVPLPAQDA
jgi:hypothetical protein